MLGTATAVLGYFNAPTIFGTGHKLLRGNRLGFRQRSGTQLFPIRRNDVRSVAAGITDAGNLNACVADSWFASDTWTVKLTLM